MSELTTTRRNGRRHLGGCNRRAMGRPRHVQDQGLGTLNRAEEPLSVEKRSSAREGEREREREGEGEGEGREWEGVWILPRHSALPVEIEPKGSPRSNSAAATLGMFGKWKEKYCCVMMIFFPPPSVGHV